MGDMAAKTALPLPDSIQTAETALAAADQIVKAEKDAITVCVVENGRINGELLD